MARAERDALVKEDADGRKLAKLSGFQWMNVFVTGGIKTTLVPERNWRPALVDDVDVARVKCVCEHEITVLAAAVPVECECGRWFFYDTTRVYAMCKPESSAA